MVSSVLEKTATAVKESALILWFEEVGTHDVGLVGGEKFVVRRNDSAVAT